MRKRGAVPALILHLAFHRRSGVNLVLTGEVNLYFSIRRPVLAQYSAAVVQFLGRTLTLGGMADHERRRIIGFANQILTPLVFLALAVLAYKFWA